MTIERAWPHPEVRADLAQLRARAPLTHCLTNIVASSITANVLLAIGASPAMVIAEEEVGEFATIAGAVLINVGTVTAITALSMERAAEAAAAARTPWVLDPVAMGALAFRSGIAGHLLQHRPSVIRGNASEILALSGAGSGGKGVDSTADSADSLDAARALATRTGAVVAVSGATDYITDGAETVTIGGGDVLLTRVTGTGCALGAVMATFLGAGSSPMRSAVAASAVFARTAERAGAVARGPGSFATAWLDELALIGKAEP
jgi:hydroxyethylthiazole kinase